MRRAASLAGSWYPGEAASCRATIESYAAHAASDATSRGVAVGGIAPHAGWLYSGRTACRTFAALGEPAPSTAVLLGVPHRARIKLPSVSTALAWDTPLGEAPVDRALAEEVLRAAADLVARSDSAHPAGENSIEVLVPFVRHFWPDAAILPIAVPPLPVAVAFGTALGGVLARRPERTVVIASTDLTHYGEDYYGFAPRGVGEEAHRWSKDVNDRAFLDRVSALDAAGALAEGLSHGNACGAGAVAAGIAASLSLGATRAEVLAHVTSYEERPDPRGPENFVGYAAAVFRRV